MSDQSIPAPVIYKDIAGFPGYRVGDDGSVWTCLTPKRGCSGPWLIGCVWKKMSPWPNENGYLNVSLRRDGKCIKRKLHRLILEAFVGPCPQGMEALHFPDRSPTNCNINNLRWGTKLENATDRKNHGTQVKGEQNGQSKLTCEQVLEIRSRYSSGETGESLSIEFGVTASLISGIVNRKRWVHI